jgi:hypothetical protein
MAKLWGVPVEELRAIVQRVSAEYDNNIVFKRLPERDGRAIAFTLTVLDSRKSGARRGRGGRRIAAACWHVNRDVMRAVFEYNPAARYKTAVADYCGLDSFNELYPSTAWQNIGSNYEPLYFSAACECEV